MTGARKSRPRHAFGRTVNVLEGADGEAEEAEPRHSGLEEKKDLRDRSPALSAAPFSAGIRRRFLDDDDDVEAEDAEAEENPHTLGMDADVTEIEMANRARRNHSPFFDFAATTGTGQASELRLKTLADDESKYGRSHSSPKFATERERERERGRERVGVEETTSSQRPSREESGVGETAAKSTPGTAAASALGQAAYLTSDAFRQSIKDFPNALLNALLAVLVSAHGAHVLLDLSLLSARQADEFVPLLVQVALSFVLSFSSSSSYSSTSSSPSLSLSVHARVSCACCIAFFLRKIWPFSFECAIQCITKMFNVLCKHVFCSRWTQIKDLCNTVSVCLPSRFSLFSCPLLLTV